MRKRVSLSLALLLAAGCKDSPTKPDGPSSASLEPGEVATSRGGQAATLTLQGGTAGAEYVYVAVNGSQAAGRVGVEVSGTGLEPLSGFSRSAPLDGTTSVRGPAGGHQGFHEALRERERRELTPLLRGGGGLAPGAILPQRAGRASPPVEGDLLRLNTGAACDTAAASPRTGRVVAITRHSVIVADTANPANGFTDAEYRRFGERFDEIVQPTLIANFGDPTDIDKNGRVIVFFTRAVNELTGASADSYVGGFFWGGDLFPHKDTERMKACASSNLAEMFYLMVPDPLGTVNGNVRSREFVQRVTLGVLAHEYQHLLNAARRLYVNNSPAFEEVWLNEGLSHIAEELIFYRVSGLGPKGNIGIDEIRAAPAVRAAFNEYQIQNFGRFDDYLSSPHTNSLMGDDDLATRGAAWAFLRYAADRKGGVESRFWQGLVNSTSIGLPNLKTAIGEDPIGWIRDWSVAVFADDHVPTAPQYQQPSWNFRTILPAFESNHGQFPLTVQALGSGDARFSLESGGAAYVRLRVPAGGTAKLVSTSGGAALPTTVHVSIARVR